MLRYAGVSILAAALLFAGGVAAAAERADDVVGCERAALRGGNEVEDGLRILLGAVALPGPRGFAAATSRTHERAWPYFRNAELAVRAATSGVVVEVPEGWRDRVAISWGGRPPSATVRFAACAGRPGRGWNAYAGGIHLRSAAGCVPLHVRVGGRSTTVRLGVGRACGARR